MSRIISLVGGGGKTTSMYNLANKFANRGLKVLVTTSTHILKNYEYNYQFVDDESKINEKDLFINNKICVVGINDGEKKLKAVSEEKLKKLSVYCDIILIEADGAKGLPIKFQRDNEPVIYDISKEVCIVVGLDSLDNKLKDVCFSFQQAKNIFDWEEDTILDEKKIAQILLNTKVLRKNCAGKKVYYILNKADDEKLFIRAIKIKSYIEKYVDDKVFITSNNNRNIEI